MKFTITKGPYWGAWSKFGWQKGEWGVGLNSKLVDQAINQGHKKFIIEIYNGDNFFGKYKISTKKMLERIKKNEFTIIKGLKLYQIPRSSLTKEE